VWEHAAAFFSPDKPPGMQQYEEKLPKTAKTAAGGVLARFGSSISIK